MQIILKFALILSVLICEKLIMTKLKNNNLLIIIVKNIKLYYIDNFTKCKL